MAAPAPECDIDCELAFVADLEATGGKVMADGPFSNFVHPSAEAHTGFLAEFFATIAREATSALRPKYGHLYGVESATPPNAEVVGWTLFEYR